MFDRIWPKRERCRLLGSRNTNSLEGKLAQGGIGFTLSHRIPQTNEYCFMPLGFFLVEKDFTISFGPVSFNKSNLPLKRRFTFVSPRGILFAARHAKDKQRRQARKQIFHFSISSPSSRPMVSSRTILAFLLSRMPSSIQRRFQRQVSGQAQQSAMHSGNSDSVSSSFTSLMKFWQSLTKWRRGRDSNPRYLTAHLISSQAHSTTLPPLR